MSPAKIWSDAGCFKVILLTENKQRKFFLDILIQIIFFEGSCKMNLNFHLRFIEEDLLKSKSLYFVLIVSSPNSEKSKVFPDYCNIIFLSGQNGLDRIF